MKPSRRREKKLKKTTKAKRPRFGQTKMQMQKRKSQHNVLRRRSWTKDRKSETTKQ